MAYFDYQVFTVIDGQQAVRITGVKNDPVNLVIPKQLPVFGIGTESDESNLDVADISENAFWNCTSLRSVYFETPNTTKFDTCNWFKGCTNLEYVELPALENGAIGDYTFDGCSALKCVKVRPGLKAIGSYAFRGAPIRVLFLDADGLGIIGNEAFYGNTTLQTISMPASLTYIGQHAFHGCTNAVISGINLPNLTYLGAGAFCDCHGLSGTVRLPMVNEIGSSAFSDTQISEAVISSVESVGQFAFEGCTALKSVDLGEQLKQIGYGTFDGCSALEELVLPDSLEEIVGQPWNSRCIATGCTNLRKLTIGGLPRIDEGLFVNCFDSLELLTIRGSVKEIAYAFKDIKSDVPRLRVILEEGVESIFNSAFKDSTAIVSFSLPRSLTEIVENAFYGCTNAVISGIDLPNLTFLGNAAFYDCHRLSGTVRLPMVNEIGSSAFSNTQISEAVFSSALTTVGGGAFYGCEDLSSVDLGGNVESIGQSAFEYCTALKSIDLGEQLREIGYGAFDYCSCLEELFLPDSLQRIIGGPNRIATGCSGLRKLSIGGLERIDSYVFSDCDALELLTIRGSVKTIVSAFSNIKSDTPRLQVILEEGVETLSGAFRDSTAIVSITIPQSLSFVDSYSFYGCSNLRDVKMNSSSLTELYRPNEYMMIHFTVENEALASWCDSNYAAYDFNAQIEHSVTLDTRGGTFPNRASAVLVSSWLDSLDLPIPEREGYVFGGWSLSDNKVVLWNGSAMLPYDVALYAVWLDPAEEQKYTLTLDLNGGTAVQTVYELTPEDEIDVNIPTREGYVFVGWSLYEQGNQLYTGTMPEENLTLYASWGEASGHGVYQYYGDHVVLTGYVLLEEESDVIVLPETVDGLPLTSIAENAFDGIDARMIYLPRTLSTLTRASFAGCDTLEAINVSSANETYKSIGGVLYNKDGTCLLLYPYAGSIYAHVPNGVTGIEENAFRDSRIRSISLPDSLLSIGDSAFMNSELIRMILPDHLQSIGENAFSGCGKLVYVETQSNPAAVDGSSFSNCNAALVIYGPNEDCPLRRAAQSSHCYYNPYMLTAVTDLGTQRTVLQAGEELNLTDTPLMSENRYFTGWYLEDIPETLWTDPLMPAYDLTLYAGGQDILCFDTMTDDNGDPMLTITGCSLMEAEITIPEMIGGIPVTAVGTAAFTTSHARIHVPAGVTDIAEGAFAAGTVLICEPGSFAWNWANENDCSTEERTWTLTWETGFEVGLATEEFLEGTAIALPELIRSGYAFLGWSWESAVSSEILSEAVMPANDAVLYAVWTMTDQDLCDFVNDFSWTFSETEAAINYYEGTAAVLNIPDHVHGLPVTAIDEGAFAYQDTIIRLSLPDTVTSIGEQAFFSMHSLKTIDLPAHITDLPARAFTDCIALANASLPEGLQTIGESAFENTALRSVTLPASVTLVHATAFKKCNLLSEIVVAEGNAFYESRNGVLYDIADGILVKYPAAKEGTAYAVENTWAIGAWAFEGAFALSEVSLTEDVYSLGEGAFYGTGLSEIPILGSMVTRIPASCFADCVNMVSAVIPDTVRQIGSMAFMRAGLTEVAIPDGVVSIGNNAFADHVLIRSSGTAYAKTWASENGCVFLDTDSRQIESVAFDCDSLTLKRGEKTSVSVIITPEDADASVLRFSTLDPSVALIDETGFITAISGGKTIVMVSAAEGIFAVCPVTVEVEAEGLSLILDKESLAIGENGTLQMLFQPLMVTDKTVVYTFGPSVYVDENGTVTGIREGTATIRAESANGVYDEIEVNVTKPAGTLILPASLKTIEAEAFSGINPGVLILPDGLESIGHKAFANCSSLRVLFVPGSVVNIAQDGFDGCGELLILTPSGSFAEIYAKDHQIKAVPTDIRSTGKTTD